MKMRTLAAALLAIALCPSILRADDPRITIVQSGADDFLSDMNFLFDLTGQDVQAQRKAFQEYIELMLLGVDRSRALRVDLISDGNKVRYRSSFPVKDAKRDKDDFLKNLDLFGISSKKKLRDFYELSGAYEGYLRYQDAYAVIGEEREDVPARKFVVLDETVERLGRAGGNIGWKYNLFAVLKNEKQDAKSVASRRKSYQTVQKELIASIGRMEGESDENYNLRKALIELQVSELGRYYTDSKELFLAWTLDKIAKRGKVQLALTPTPNTKLAQTIKLSGTGISRFEALSRAEDPVMSMSMYLPLDDDQAKHFTDMAKLLEDRLVSTVDASEEESADQKQAFKDMLNLFEEAIREGLENDTAKGIERDPLDGVLEIRNNESGKHTLIGGVRMKRAGKVEKMLDLLTKARPNLNLKRNVAKEGDVAIHSFDLSQNQAAATDDFFGQHTVYIGVGPDVVWAALGENAQEVLQAGIKEVAEAKDVKPGEQILSLKVHALPLLEWRDRHAGEPDPKDDLHLRKMAVESLTGSDDLLQIKLVHNDGTADGEMKIPTGFLSVAGKLLAKFTKENLE